jgi:hypothetical protein
VCEIKRNAAVTGTYCLACDIVHVAYGATLAEWSAVCRDAERIKRVAVLDLVLAAAAAALTR